MYRRREHGRESCVAALKKNRHCDGVAADWLGMPNNRRDPPIRSRHHEHINHSVWCGIHELTNSKGKECHHSCPTQAWSMSCLLDAFHDAIAKFGQAH
jgi:hypothetical protein